MSGSKATLVCGMLFTKCNDCADSLLNPMTFTKIGDNRINTFSP